MAKGKKGFLAEYLEFINRGKVVNVAAAVVAGVAFLDLIESFIKNVVIKMFSAVITSSIPDLNFTLNGSVVPFGAFLDESITFIGVSLALFFFLIRPMNYFSQRRQRQAVAAGVPAASAVVVPDDVRLLTEIRDLLQSGARLPERPPTV